MTLPSDLSARSSVGRTIAKNTVAITLGSGALRALNFLYGVYVVRQLGDERLGQYSTVLAWVGLFQILAELGVSQYVMREIARDRTRVRELFWNLVAIRFGLALVGIAGITAGARAMGYPPMLVWGVFLYTWTFVLSAIEAPLEVVLAAHERLDYVTGLTILAQLTTTVVGAVVLYAGGGFVALIAVGLGAMLPQIGLAVWLVRRHKWLEGRPLLTPRQWPRFIRAGLPFGLISLALTIAFSIDTVMLSRVVSPNEVGWYNVGYGLVRSVVAFLTAFSVAMVPSLSKIYATDMAQVERWYYRSVKFIMLLSTPMAVGGMLVAFPLFAFLYTPDFKPAALGLQILIWDVPLLMFTAFCGNMTTVVGEERAAARIYSINAVANVLLNWYAIPRFGLIGAALVTVTTDLIGALQFHFLLQRKMKMPNLTGLLARIIVAAALMGGVVWLAGQAHLLVLIGLGALTYGVLAWVLRLIDAEEWALVRRLVQRIRKAPSAGA